MMNRAKFISAESNESLLHLRVANQTAHRFWPDADYQRVPRADECAAEVFLTLWKN
jgi:hypothetical protein